MTKKDLARIKRVCALGITEVRNAKGIRRAFRKRLIDALRALAVAASTPAGRPRTRLRMLGRVPTVYVGEVTAGWSWLINEKERALETKYGNVLSEVPLWINGIVRTLDSRDRMRHALAQAEKGCGSERVPSGKS